MAVTNTTVTNTLKDAAYVTIGFGVLGFQKAQVGRHELGRRLDHQRAQLEAQLVEGRRTVNSLASQLDTYVAPVRSQLEAQIEGVEAVLPVGVQDLMRQAREMLHNHEQIVRSHLGLSPGTLA